jgi:glutamyl-tRNA synthetase
MNQRPARVRFAPSPTGRTHLGSGRTALYDFLLARQTGGQFILRIEDTDQRRYVPGAEEELIRSLKWLGLDWDEGIGVGGSHEPYRQSERREIYQQHARWLVENHHAYYCFCTPERLAKVRQQQMANKQPTRYDGTCRLLDPEDAQRRARFGEPHVIRFRSPNEGAISFKDRLRGEITVENRNIDDFIIVKSDGLALYHLAAMVDDHLMDITHVIRGSEWLSTFPLHVHIIRAFGWQEPEWVHLSVFLKPSGKGKMSKRESSELMKDGYSIFIDDLKDLGYLPESVVNWIALMGWSFDDRTEFFTMQDLVEKFSLDHLNPSPAAINFSKLDHFNGLHIRSLPVTDLANRIKPFFESSGYQVDEQTLLAVTPLIQERLVTLDEAPERGSFFFQKDVHPDPSELVGKNMTAGHSLEAAQRALLVLESLPDFSHEQAEPPLRQLAEEMGLNAGQLFGILRVAITGQAVSPPLLESMTVIGRGKVLQRMRSAIHLLETRPH